MPCFSSDWHGCPERFLSLGQGGRAPPPGPGPPPPDGGGRGPGRGPLAGRQDEALLGGEAPGPGPPPAAGGGCAALLLTVVGIFFVVQSLHARAWVSARRAQKQECAALPVQRRKWHSCAECGRRRGMIRSPWSILPERVPACLPAVLCLTVAGPGL
ncbi:unnamed protein product [Prorocentrum cordatum]|uniref:Protein S-acyltransferase n=1 Tax=Prorocentrum cordatum TaxID=2364126 RepID=A0ABN9UAJ1_9DINO|nr:unnamed protein product [Polarella glacialis]